MKLATASILLLALALPVSADHCITYATTEATVDVRTPAGRYYVQSDKCQPCGTWDIWIHEESNGIDGLQRANEWYDDTCHGLIAPDRLLL